MKTKCEKRLNNKVKDLNRRLKRDVFGDRFWVRQVRKSKTDGTTYFLFELRDRLEPERNELIRGWISEYSYFSLSEISLAMNDFIINSNFWQLYKKAQKAE